LNGLRAIFRGARRGDVAVVPSGPSPPTGLREYGESGRSPRPLAARSVLKRNKFRDGGEACEYRRDDAMGACEALAGANADVGGVEDAPRPVRGGDARPAALL
jgi:hypothetical protein